MHVLVICAVFFFVTVNVGPVSTETSLESVLSFPVDKILRVWSFFKSRFGDISSILASLTHRLCTVNTALLCIGDFISTITKIYTAMSGVGHPLEISSSKGGPVTREKHGWMGYRFYKFYKCQKECSADDAEKLCEAEGATLASLKSAVLNEFVSSLVTDDTIAYYYAGARDDLVEGEWRWADGSRAVYTNWAENEPNNRWGREHCLLVLRDQKNTWNDVPCSSKMNIGYICEK